jgi:hypothetical protein
MALSCHEKTVKSFFIMIIMTIGGLLRLGSSTTLK